MVCQVKAPLYSDQLLLLSLIPTAVPLIAIVASLSPTWQLQGLARQARALLAIPANSRKTNQFAVCFVLFSPFSLIRPPLFVQWVLVFIFEQSCSDHLINHRF